MTDSVKAGIKANMLCAKCKNYIGTIVIHADGACDFDALCPECSV